MAVYHIQAQETGVAHYWVEASSEEEAAELFYRGDANFLRSEVTDTEIESLWMASE